MFAPAEIEKLNAALQSKIGFENVWQIIDFTYNANFFVHFPNAHTSREFGGYYLNKSGARKCTKKGKAGLILLCSVSTQPSVKTAGLHSKDISPKVWIKK